MLRLSADFLLKPVKVNRRRNKRTSNVNSVFLLFCLNCMAWAVAFDAAAFARLPPVVGTGAARAWKLG